MTETENDQKRAAPREVLTRLLDAVANKDWDQLPVLFAPDAVVERPFGLPEATRIEGHEAIMAKFAGPASFLDMQARNLVVYETADPELIIAEYDYDGHAQTTGKPFRTANIQVLRVREGKIVESRDYHNHAVLGAALGRLPELVAQMD